MDEINETFLNLDIDYSQFQTLSDTDTDAEVEPETEYEVESIEDKREIMGVVSINWEQFVAFCFHNEFFQMEMHLSDLAHFFMTLIWVASRHNDVLPECNKYACNNCPSIDSNAISVGLA